MKKLPQNRLVLAIIAVFIIVFVLFYSSKKISEPSQLIPLATVSLTSLEVNVDAVGELDSEKSITISSELREEGKIIFLIEDGTKLEERDVLVRIDPTPFEQKVDDIKAKLDECNIIVAAQQQTLELEKIQAEREINNAEYDYQVAVLEFQKLEKGDGPLELSRLEGAALEAKKLYEDLKGFIQDLVALEEKGYSNPLEIAQAKGRLEKLEKSYEIARKQFESYKDYIFPTLIKTASTKVERTKMIIDQTKRAVSFKVGKSIAELNKSKQELNNYKDLLKSAQIELEKTIIRAPQPGLVVLKEAYRDGEMRKPRVGDVVIQNQPILFLPDVSSMIVKVLIREVDLHKIEIGKPAFIQVDAYPEVVFEGKVSFIGVLAERREEVRGVEKYFRVHVIIQEPNSRLRPGMTARVKIVAQEEKEKTLTIPIHSVFQEEGKNFCYVPRQNGFEMREVLLGSQNEEVVEVCEGLEKGEKVCLSRPPSDIVNTVTLVKNAKKSN